MAKGMLILDIQHLGKPNRPGQLGAHADLDGDGVKEVWEAEAMLTPHYASAATRIAVARGHRAAVLTQGTYASRHAQAYALARQANVPTLYIACHFNAGGGNYGLVLYDGRDGAAGRIACGCVVGALKTRWRPHGVRVLTPQSTSLNNAKWPRPFATIDGIYDNRKASGSTRLLGLCLEPLFVDNPDHAGMLQDPLTFEEIGQALVDGLEEWITRVD